MFLICLLIAESENALFKFPSWRDGPAWVEVDWSAVVVLSVCVPELAVSKH
jgi:hypothetical protein